MTQLKEGLQINLRGRGRVGQVEVTEHLRVHGAEEANDLAVLLEEDLGTPPLEEGWIGDVAQSIAVGGHGQHHEDSLDLQVDTSVVSKSVVSYLLDLDGKVRGGDREVRGGVGRPFSG